MKRGHIALVWLSLILSTLSFVFGFVSIATVMNRSDEQARAMRERNQVDKELAAAMNRQSDILERWIPH